MALTATMTGANSMRILLVEDEEDMAGALTEALEHEAYAVDLAVNGIAADELAYINDYDLVVLDWTIPAPTGIELLDRWRSAGNQMPVLMLTDHVGIKDGVSALDTGGGDDRTRHELDHHAFSGHAVFVDADPSDVIMEAISAAINHVPIERRDRLAALRPVLLTATPKVIPRLRGQRFHQLIEEALALAAHVISNLLEQRPAARVQLALHPIFERAPARVGVKCQRCRHASSSVSGFEVHHRRRILPPARDYGAQRVFEPQWSIREPM
jgi:CheY-like chemotaxis protein